jgi:hypothetical protein
MNLDRLRGSLSFAIRLAIQSPPAARGSGRVRPKFASPAPACRGATWAENGFFECFHFMGKGADLGHRLCARVAKALEGLRPIGANLFWMFFVRPPTKPSS